MTDFPDLKLKTLVSFPAAVFGGAGIAVRQQNGSFYFDLSFADFAPPVTTLPDAANQNALLWDSISGSYMLTPISLFAGAITTDAPLDGALYGRSNAAWLKGVKLAGDTMTGPLNLTTPLSPASGGTGVASLGTRGIVVGHGTAAVTTVEGNVGNSSLPLLSQGPSLDPVYAALPNAALQNSSITIGSTPIALGGTAATIAGLTLTSPTLANTPTTPTAAPGTNTTQVASTAFVAAAVTAGTAGVASIGGQTGAILLSAADLAMSGSTMQLSAARRTGMTTTVLLSGSGSYTVKPGCIRLEVAVQGGAGGAGSSGTTAGTPAATAGGNSFFGSFVANGSGAANQYSPGAVPSASGGYLNLSGASAQPGIALNSQSGGAGGASPYGGNGWGGNAGGTAGSSAVANTGSGGGGGGAYTASGNSGAGSNSGAYCLGIINNPVGPYSWQVGAGGTGQGAGGSGYVGGNGAAGSIIIKEYYN